MNSVPESNVELVLAIKEALWEVQRKGLEVQVHWCTGHMNIYGNELADKFAKEAGFYCPQSLTYQGCKIPLARSHWRVNIDGGRVKLAMRSPDRASVFLCSDLSSFSPLAGKMAKRQPDLSEVYSGGGDHFLVCKYYP